MPTHFTVTNIKTDEDTISRTSEVRIGSSGEHKFKTPLKVGLYGVSDSPFYENYKSVKPSTVANWLQSENQSRRYGSQLRSQNKGEFNILTLEYNSRDVTPSDKMIEALSDMQYAHSDVIVTPSWFELITMKNKVDVELFISLSKKFVDISSTLNHKPIFGSIPQSIPPNDIDKVIKFYLDNDITSFRIDSHGRSLLNGTWNRTLQRQLSTYQIEKECVLYSMNAFQGTIPKNQTTIEAKDFMGFAVGYDVLGGKHVVKFAPDQEKESKTIGRLFNRDTYTYEKHVCTEEEKKHITENTIREQNAELQHVREVISQGSVKKLLESKTISKETLRGIMDHKSMSKSSLDNFI